MNCTLKGILLKLNQHGFFKACLNNRLKVSRGMWMEAIQLTLYTWPFKELLTDSLIKVWDNFNWALGKFMGAKPTNGYLPCWLSAIPGFSNSVLLAASCKQQWQKSCMPICPACEIPRVGPLWERDKQCFSYILKLL